jgi:uncharacterized 2Fe-2S/4Fe-4S cluster protein (DUF4445 family)
MKNNPVKITAVPGRSTHKTVLDILTARGITVPAVCGGKARCGLCRVRLSGKTPLPGPAEIRLIPRALINKGYRLACRQPWTAGLKITIPPVPKTRCKNLSRLGLALDLGTTVIKGAVCDLTTGEIIDRRAIFNPQNNLGGDVLTRVTEALGGKYRLLRQLLLHGIDSVKNYLNVKEPTRTMIVGNPVMLSFFLNQSLTGYARHPFDGRINYRAVVKRGGYYVFPVIGGFVGGDTLAGLCALRDASENPTTRLYLDLGTNGEVVIMKNGNLWATSTAAGPAFEGNGVSCGSLATPGAIDRVTFDNKFRIHRIAGGRPTGFCASGLIDLLAAGLKSGRLEENGRLKKPIKIGGLSLTQEDIRILQLAIAALHTGIQILMEKTGVDPSQLDEAVITGEFGRHLNIPSLVRIGILPAGIRSVRCIGDLPLKGAVKALINENTRKEIADLKKVSRHVDLARQPDFQKKFIAALRLKPWA